MKNQQLFAILVAAALFAISAPASAGKWSGSTPDNGMGQSVSASGTSNEVVNLAACTITYTSTSTTIVTDNATGRVVSTTTRNRTKVRKIKPCPPVGKPKPAEFVSAISTTVTLNNNPDGTSTSSGTDERSGPGNGYQRTDTSTTFNKPDGGGEVTGGTKRTIERNTAGGKTTRTVTDQQWDPSSGTWTEKARTASGLVPRSASLVLPGSATSGGYAEGQVLITYVDASGSSEQAAATANVVIAEPNGRRITRNTLADGMLLLGADALLAGRLRVRADAGEGMNAAGEVKVGARDVGVSPHLATSWTNPPVVQAGNSLTLRGTGLAAGDAPLVLACTPGGGCFPAMTQAVSDTEVMIVVPRGLPPGPCSLLLENAKGRFTQPLLINPVAVSLELPKSGYPGAMLDAVVRLTGLVPENLGRALTGTVNLLGPGTFADGSTSQTVSISGGVAHVKIVAHATGVIAVNVRDVH